MHRLFPVWVSLQHELNMRNVKCVSDFLLYVHCKVDLEYELFFVLGYYEIAQVKLCNTYYIWMWRWNMTLVYLFFPYFYHLQLPPGPVQDSWLLYPVYWPCYWLLHMRSCDESPCSRGWSIAETCQGCIPYFPLILLRCGRCRSLPYPWSVEPDWLSRFHLWSASWWGHIFPPWSWTSCWRGCPP